MKKSLRYLALGLVLTSFNVLVSIAQPTLDFARGIGAANDDKGTSVAVLDSFGTNIIYATGTFKSATVNFNPTATTRNLTNASSITQDVYLGKYKPSGVLAYSTSLGAFRIGSSLDDDATKIYIDASKNVYVVGTLTGTSRVDRFNVSFPINGGSGVGYVIKYDKDFTVLWAIGFGDGTPTTGGARVNDIAVDNSGNVYVTGMFQSPSPVDFNLGPQGTVKDIGPFTPVTLSSNSAGYDAFVAKYTPGGTCAWAINMGGASSDEGNGIGTDASGNVYVTGVFRGQTVDFDPSAGGIANLSETGGGSSSGDIFVAKYSTLGSYMNAFNIGNALFEGVTGIAVESSTGDFAISGYFGKDALPIDFDPDPVDTTSVIAVGSSGTDMFVAKYSSSLTLNTITYQWHKTVGSTGSEKANAIKLSGSNLFVTGSYQGTATNFGNSNSLTAIGGLDAFMAGYSFSSGTCLFASSLGGASDEEGLGIDYVNNKLLVTGYYKGSGDYDPSGGTTTLNNSGGQDIFLAQYAYSACTLPSITTQPASLNQCTGTSASFSVVATGATSFQWKKGGVNVSVGTGATTASYTIPSVVSGDAGNYTVEVINGCGTVTSSPAAVLTVNTPASITTQPSSLAQCPGTTATFTVVATGTAPLTYQWQKGGVNATGTSTNASYVINSIAAGDAGNYTVIVNNVCSTAVTSSPAAVLTVNTPASITTQPSSLAQCPGTTATFTVVATGTAPLTYQWQKGGVNATGTSTNASYVINSIATGDAGNYTVIVNNVCSTAVTSTPAAVLTVNTPASITTQPSSLAQCPGTTATFTVVATGTAPLTYQWQKGGVNATGTSTNASYVINSIAAGDAGNYTVIVNNVCSTAVASTPAAVLTVNTPASITTQPSSLAQCPGTTATFTVVATGTAPLTYQWQKGGVNATGTSTNASYVINSIAAGDAGNYTVIVNNVCSTAVTSTPAAVLTVNTPASITTQPSSLAQCPGTTATFTVVATGTAPLTYQWQKGGVNATGTSTNASYVINSIAAGDAGNYTVIVNNVCSTAVTSTPAAVLTVNTPASITTQPSSLAQCPGTTATFTVVATGTAPLTYQWQKGGVNATGTSTNASYVINSIAAGDAGNYTVIVNNACSTAVTSSPAAVLTVNTPASITTQPSSLAQCPGTTATFTVVATGTAPLTYQWQKGGVNATGTSTNASYVINSIAAGDAGNYTVIVNNVCSTAVTSSPAAVLTVNTPASITTQPSSLAQCPGTTATFTVVATGTAPLTYQWQKGGVNATGTSTNASYVINSIAAGDAGNYTVIVNNVCSTAVTSTPAAVLTVNTPASITTQPSSLAQCPGTTATFTVVATGTAPLTYQWQKGGVNATGTSTNASYVINSIAAGDAGNYTVIVNNVCSTAVTSTPAAVLTVNTPASITTQPSSLAQCPGTTATFTVVATGTAPLTYQWQKGGVNATGTSTNASYVINSIAAGDAGNYTVIVNNVCSTAVTSTPAAVLTVNTPASITTQPSSLSRCTGTTATFTVVATGTAPLTYQWQKGGVNATGTSTNASYVINSIAAGDAGNYTVIVNNVCSTAVTSTPAAVLTVNSPITSNAGSAQTICNTTAGNLSGNNPSPGTGAWTLAAGTGTVTTPSSATSGVTGLTVGSPSTFTWTITNGACVTSSNVTITVSSPVTADAGPNQALCNVTSTVLAATGTGTWSTFSGTGVAATPSSATSNVNGLTIGASTTMRWTVTNGACSASSDMVITVSSPGSANAGTDQTICNSTSATLAAAGVGTWTKISGTGTVTTPSSATSGVTGLTVGATSVFEWTVSAGACSGTDQVSITISALPIGSAGANQSFCGLTTATLAATGTGTWTTTSGTGVVTTPSSASSGVTGLTIGASSVFAWTVTNGACSTTTNTTIASNAFVSITTPPVASTTLCTGNAFNLNVVATGSGTLTYQWKKGASNANGASTASNYSIPSVVFGDAGNYTVDVTNSCGTVTSSIAQLTIQNLAITTQPAPATQAVCAASNVVYSVMATGPSVSYQWKKNTIDISSETGSSLNLNNVSVADAGSYTVLISGCSNSILSNAATLIVSVCTGTTDETNANRFSIYPNPAMTTVHLNGFAQDPIKSIMMVDVSGEVVYQENNMNAASYDISVSSYAQGLYHIILFTSSGNKWIEKIEISK